MGILKRISIISLSIAKKTSQMWYMVASLSDASLVCPRSTFQFFEYWYLTNLSSRSILAWRLAFYVMAWSVWNIRNHIVFHQEVFDEYAYLKLFRYHYAWWMRKTFGDIAPTFIDISRCLNRVTSPLQRISPHYYISWSPPPNGIIKVNMNGSFNALNSQGVYINALINFYF